jgi:hypothetical protein
VVFTIHNRDNKGFIIYEVEFWEDKMDCDINLWYSRIAVRPHSAGFIELIDNLVKSGRFDKETLIEDTFYVEELKEWLWQATEAGMNDSLPMEEAEKRHYHEFLPHIKEVLKAFCDRYNLYLNED